MAKQERGLGKGLDALLGGNAALGSTRRPLQYINKSSVSSAPREGDVMLVNIDDISPNPFQPRVSFDEQQLRELADSISSLGLIQPITVRALDGGKYQIISGERRYRASRLAGKTQIPAYIRTAGDTAMLEMAIVENVQRADLDPIETAVSYQRLMDDCGLTQEKLAERIGKSRVSVTNFLRLLRLPPRVQYDLKKGSISVGHAKVLLSVESSELQERLCADVIREGLSVRALEDKIKALASSIDGKSSSRKSSGNDTDYTADLPDYYYGIVESVGQWFNNNVSVKRSAGGKGTITVRFSSDEQVKAFFDALKK